MSPTYLPLFVYIIVLSLNAVNSFNGGFGGIRYCNGKCGEVKPTFFMNTVTRKESFRMVGSVGERKTRSSKSVELELLELLSSSAGKGRGQNVDKSALDQIKQLVAELEKNVGLLNPTDTEEINGRWRLLFTTTPGTASPIQRSFVGVDAFAVYQDIDLKSEVSQVVNVVDFGEKIGALRVGALASTVSRPLPNFTPRQGDGKIFGLNIFGVSSTTPPLNPKQRIDFKFDDASFSFTFLPFKIPYPVPFRYLGDEVTGWIDITYLSSEVRIARGNKGTLFILQKHSGYEAVVN